MGNYVNLVFSDAPIDEIMEPYSEDYRVEPYWRELDPAFIASIVKEHSPNNPSLSEKDIVLTYGSKNWKCENGVWFEMSTKNPQGYWNYFGYTLSWNDTPVEDEWSPAPILASKVPEKFLPDAYIDQYGDWHWRWDATDEAAWNELFRNALQKYTGMVTLIHCHN